MRESEFNTNGAAHEVGSEGVDHLVAGAEELCGHEQDRIALENEAHAVRLQAQNAVLFDTERTLQLRLQSAPPPGSLARLRLRAIYYWTVTIVLVTAGFMLVLLTFEPFNLGPKAWVYSVGIAVVSAFLIAQWLQRPNMEKPMERLTLVAGVAGLASLMIFSLIRGSIFAEEIRANQASSVVIDGDPQPEAATQNTFYEETVWLLRLGMVLLAFSMETAAGLALHHAWHSVPDNSENWDQLRKQLGDVRNQRGEIAHELMRLQNEPHAFAAKFRRDFSRAMISKARRNGRDSLPLLIFAAAVLGSTGVRAQAPENSITVIAIDLSATVDTPGPDGKTDFQKNIDGVTQILAHLQNGSAVTVIGITDRSYAQPYILLSAHIPIEPGYFGERLAKARTQLVHVWAQRSTRLSHSFRRTDILGALQLAEDLFEREPNSAHRRLIVFSDMRQDTLDVNLDRLPLVPPYRGAVKSIGPVPEFGNVDAYLLGVDGVGKSPGYWRSLRVFWTDYFQSAKVTVVTYSALRDLPQVGSQIVATGQPR